MLEYCMWYKVYFFLKLHDIRSKIYKIAYGLKNRAYSFRVKKMQSKTSYNDILALYDEVLTIFVIFTVSRLYIMNVVNLLSAALLDKLDV